jgi:hypothetical protein
VGGLVLETVDGTYTTGRRTDGRSTKADNASLILLSYVCERARLYDPRKITTTAHSCGLSVRPTAHSLQQALSNSSRERGATLEAIYACHGGTVADLR